MGIGSSVVHGTCTDGILLSSIYEFVEDYCDGIDNIKGLTTEYIHKKYLKPITKKAKQSYCQYLKSSSAFNNPNIGKAILYVSHTWEYEFAYVLETIDYYVKTHYNTSKFEKHQHVYIFLDIFSRNPHISPIINDDYLTTNILLSIKDIGHTLMICSPYTESLTFKNTWNLFELYSSVSTKTRVSLGMIEGDKKKLDKEISNDAFNVLNRITSCIKITNSKCNTDNEKAIIIEFIKKKIDSEHADLLMQEELKNSIIDYVKHEMNDTKYIDAYRLTMENSLAIFSLGEYKFDEALGSFQSIFKRRTDLLGHFHEDTIYTISCMAALYTNLGQYDEAIELYTDALDKYKKTVGLDHPSYFATMNNLANIYYNLGRFKESESLHKSCYVRKQHTLGDLHPDTLTSMNNLAGIYRIQNKLSLAEQLYVKCLEAKKNQLGMNDLSTLSTMQCLASLYDDQKKFDKAEELYEICLMQRREILGENNAIVLGSMNNLAIIYMDQKKFDKAEELYRACLEKKRKILGDSHNDTSNTMNGLGICLRKMRKHKESEQIFRECLSILVKNKFETNSNENDDMISYTKDNLDKLLRQIDTIKKLQEKGLEEKSDIVQEIESP